MFQPKSRGGEPNRETQSMVPKAFRSCPPQITHAAYLEPISGSMQKPIEGLPARLKKIEEGSAIVQKHNQNHAENYLKGGYRQNGAQQSVLVVLFYVYHSSVAFEVVADAFE